MGFLVAKTGLRNSGLVVRLDCVGFAELWCMEIVVLRCCRLFASRTEVVLHLARWLIVAGLTEQALKQALKQALVLLLGPATPAPVQ